MEGARTPGNLSPGLRRVMERARRNPHERQVALAYLIDVDALRRSYQGLGKDSAVGVDGVTKEQYGQNLEENLQDLHVRLKTMKYRHQPIRRVHIPKDRNRRRPIGIPTTEDKIVQGALCEILEAIYEQDFLDCSHGFRPGRRPHDALRVLNQVVRRAEANVILEGDVVSFDSIDRPMLIGDAPGAEDCVICFESRQDAERVKTVLGKRFGRYRLGLQPDKTRLVEFRRPPWSQTRGKGPGTFEFLGFTVYWRRNQRGRGWHLSWKTRKARLRRAINTAHELCRRQRHRSVPEQHLALTRRIQGHFNYFGVNDNQQSLSILLYHVRRAWYKWLNRRSQRSRLNWQRFEDLARDFPFPSPRVYVNLWASP